MSRFPNKKAVQTKRRGFTLMEIIFAVVIVGALAGIVIPKILDNSRKSQLMGTVQSDAKTIISRVAEWKTNDPNSKGSYLYLSPQALSDYLPATMKVENSTDTKAGDEAIVDSSGYGNNLIYRIKGDSANSIYVLTDYSKIINNTDDRKKYGKQIANIFIKLSQDKTKTKIDTRTNPANGQVKVVGIVP